MHLVLCSLCTKTESCVPCPMCAGDSPHKCMPKTALCHTACVVVTLCALLVSEAWRRGRSKEGMPGMPCPWPDPTVMGHQMWRQMSASTARAVHLALAHMGSPGEEKKNAESATGCWCVCGAPWALRPLATHRRRGRSRIGQTLQAVVWVNLVHPSGRQAQRLPWALAQHLLQQYRQSLLRRPRCLLAWGRQAWCWVTFGSPWLGLGMNLRQGPLGGVPPHGGGLCSEASGHG
jgi:hypothetical protein